MSSVIRYVAQQQKPQLIPFLAPVTPTFTLLTFLHAEYDTLLLLGSKSQALLVHPLVFQVLELEKASEEGQIRRVYHSGNRLVITPSL